MPDTGDTLDPCATQPAAQFTVLPDHIRLEDTITSQPAAEPADPTMGRDPDQDFMLRYI
ncbi:MAG TPA: heme biosynthesis protein HemY [Cellulomonas sp.]|nr:heme biosynthesis protein HemY [Cellulomonas sp.]